MNFREQFQEKESNWFALLVVMGGVFLSTMDSGMVNVALPTVMRHFNLAIEESEVVVTAYLFTITVTLVFWGRIADHHGLKKVYLTGLLVFSLGAWFCYFLESYTLLITSRFVQGLGASMMMASGPAIVKTSFPAGRLGRNLGLIGIATASGLLSGPPLCGYLLSHFSWRSIFVLLGGVSLAVFFMGIVLFRGHHDTSERDPQSDFDWIGGFCWVGLVVVTMHLLQSVNQLSMSAILLRCSVLFCLLLFFIYTEKKAAHPILPLADFRKRYYWVAIVTAALSFFALFSVLVLIPFYLEYVQHFSIRQIGSIMMAVPATLILFAPTAGYLYDKIGAKYLTTFGLLVSCSALLGLSELSEVSSKMWIVFLLAAMGAGQSIFLSPNSASVLSRVGDLRAASTAGILATARNFGMAVGATVGTMLFSYFGAGLLSDGGYNIVQQFDSGLFVLAFGSTLKCIAGLVFAACFISTVRD